MFYGQALEGDLRVFTGCTKKDGGARETEVTPDEMTSRKQ